MDAYLIIGNSNTRKTSVVRSLTGCFNRNVRDIQLHAAKTPIRLYARVGSLQHTRTGIEEFLAECRRTRCQAVICCLLPSAHPDEPERFPDAQSYLAAFLAAGWHCKGIAVLGQNGGGVRSDHLRQYPLAPTAPINVTARDIRAQFGWV